MMLPSTEVVLDIETMGTQHDAVVVSVGMVRILWDTELNEWVVPSESSSYSLYLVMDVTKQFQLHRSVDTSTMRWWADQRASVSDILQKAFLIPGELSRQCTSINQFVREINNTRVWGNGPNFDNKILNHLVRSMLPTDLCHFRNERDIRTARDILSSADREALMKNPLPHHALYDARQEARMLIAANRKLLDADIPPWISRPDQNF